MFSQPNKFNRAEWRGVMGDAVFEIGSKSDGAVSLKDIAKRKRVEAALRDSEERYRGLVAISPDAIYIERNDRVVLINNAALRLFGANRREQLLGKRASDLFHPSSHFIMEAHIREALQKGKPLPPIEAEILRLDRSVRDVEVAACPFPDQGGTSLQVVLHDKTERKLIERNILAAVEQERQRTGRELHDGLCQLLTSTKFKTSLLEHKLASKSLAEAAEAKDIEKDLMQEIKQAVSIAHGLNPVKGLSRGLMAALEELAARVEGAFQLRCVCEFPTPVAIPDQTAAHHLYRITQEAVNNAVKHGKGRNIRIQLKNARGGIVLKVFDDGVGLPRTLERKGGMGFHNLKARASLIGASLDIRCAQPHGTIVTCRFRSQPPDQS